MAGSNIPNLLQLTPYACLGYWTDPSLLWFLMSTHALPLKWELSSFVCISAMVWMIPISYLIYIIPLAQSDCNFAASHEPNQSRMGFFKYFWTNSGQRVSNSGGDHPEQHIQCHYSLILAEYWQLGKKSKPEYDSDGPSGIHLSRLPSAWIRAEIDAEVE